MKRLIYSIVALFASIGFVMNVNAASGSITASSSTKTAVVGSTFNVTVKVSCSEALGSWQFGISYDSSYISLQSGDTTVADFGDGKTKTKSYTYKFKAIKSGTASVRVNGASMVTWNDVDKLFTPSVTNAQVSVKTQAQIEASYSKDNTLKSLNVSGFTLNPVFDKNTTEYSLEVPDNTESIVVSATVNDKNASVRGTGTIDVSEGSNKVDVVVTAQNGATKTYTINVVVKDLHPISVKIGEEEYLVVKKVEMLTNPSGFTPTSIKIDEIDIPAFTSELAGITLVGLKNSEGTIDLYIYDNNTYEKYNEVKSSSITLYPIASSEELEGFNKDVVSINGIEYEAFKKDDETVIYAMNIETGKKDYYVYSSEDNAFIKYKKDTNSKLNEEVQESKIYIYALVGVSVILFAISVTLSRKNSRLKKVLLKMSDKINTSESDKETT